jgi:ribosomal protein S18 acetylase RimI-like enzyme
MSVAEVAIRAAVPADAPAIAALHVAAWREAYRNLAPPEAVRRLDLHRRRSQWTAMLAKAERTMLVAERDGRIVGIGTAGAATVPALGARGEILYLYVDPAHARTGIGRALMRRLALSLREHGYKHIALGVVEGNRSAIDFYRKLGGRPAGSYIDPGPLWRSRNQIIIWDDVDILLT